MRRLTAGFTLCLAMAVAGPASGAEYETGSDWIRASEGGRVLWENVHGPGDRQRPPGDPGRLTPPVVAGESVFYAVGNQLYQVEEADGTVRVRVPLPAGATDLRAEEGAVVVTVGEDYLGSEWRRDYTVDPARPRVPFFPATGVHVLSLRREAQRVLSDALATGDGAPGADPDDAGWRGGDAARPWLEAALAELDERERWDATNPWYAFQRGLYLHDLGRTEEARAASEAALAVDEPYSGELLAMSLELDAIDPGLGERAFERGLGYLVRRGYDPGMAHALIALLVHYGQPDPDRPLDAARLERHARRIWRLAPEVEGAAYLYAAVAEALEAAGDREGAARWKQRAVDGLPRASMMPGGRVAERAGPALNGVLAALMALLLTVFVKGVRYLPTQRRAKRSGWNPLSLWTRGEVLGTLVVIGLLFYSSWVTTRGIAAIGRAAALPIAAGAGNYGHPAAVESFGGLAGSPGGDFVYALALQKAGRLEEARALYESLDDPHALNNLGVLLAAQGETGEARALFERAAGADPGLAVAALNAGREAELSPRVETLERCGAEAPWLALPSDAQWDDALVAPLSPFAALDRFFDAFQTIGVIASTAPRGFARADLLDTGAIVVSVTLLVSMIAVAALFWRPGTAPRSTPVSRAGWALGFLVPGTARQLGAAGPVLLWVAGYSFVVDRTLATSNGTGSDILSAISRPAFERALGAASWIHSPLEQAVRATSDWWWMLWVANLVFVVALERWRPDPCGPAGREREGQDG